jgi:hypothetical protein
MMVIGGLLIAGGQLALGANITIYDGVSSGTGWYGSVENNEVEPNCVPTQAWDLERFDLNGTTLRLTGGWNFQSGYEGNASGDIFIDVDGNAVWGQDVFTASTSNGNLPTGNNLYGYDYVIHFNRTGTAIASAYSVVQLSPNSTVALTTPYYRQNDESSPWIYVDGGTEVANAGGRAVFGELASDAEGRHFTMDVDVGFLGTDLSGDLFKFTMQCGNDNLIGRVPVPDGGVTAMLLGVGLVGLATLKRRLLS